MSDETVVPLLPRIDLSEHGEEVEVVIISDIHFGSDDFHEKKWQADKAYVLASDPAKTRLLMLGDIFQFDTKYQKHSGVYNQVLSPDEQAERAVDELGSLVPYTDLLLAGNHDNRVLDAVGYDATKHLATQLGLRDRYVRDNAVVQYAVGRSEGRRTVPFIYHVYAYHGDGNGQSRASLERAGNLCLADAYVSGHTHDPLVFTDRIYLPHPQTQSMTYRDRLYLATGAYQMGSGYTLRKNYRPRRYGRASLFLNPHVRRIDGRL